jgi:hypothetical protein
VVVPGNHDHRLLGGWRERRALDPAPTPLGDQSDVRWRDGEPLEELAGWLAPASVRAAYPGIWLRDDVYATHGHYSDRHNRVPILERLGAGVMARIGREPVGGPRSTDAYEATFAPMYAWIDAVAQGGGLRGRGGGGLQVRAWRSLQARGRADGSRRQRRRRSPMRRARARSLGLAFPAIVGAFNRMGLGPLDADMSIDALRRGGVFGFAEVLHRLELRPTYCLFGHTHRAGPLPADDHSEWRAPGGTHMLNTGSWVRNGALVGPAPDASPYRPGFAVMMGDEGPPELVNLLD